MRFSWHRQVYSKIQTPLVGVFLVSFVAGSIGGAVFGLLSATAITGIARKQLVGFAQKFGVRQGQVAPSQAIGNSSAGQKTVVDVVRQSAPAVVSIVITKDVPKFQNLNPFFSPFGGNPFGDDFFNQFFAQPQAPSGSPGTQKQKVGGGTGFFVDASGLILTNKHVVVDETAEYTVVTNSGKQYNARVLSRDSVNDLAVVKIEGSNFPILPLGDSRTLVLGQSVIAIGNALGEFGNTVSTGVISGLSRSITASGTGFGSEQLRGVIQTDAAINPGNSGGPLLNADGEVIGINTAVAQGAQNIGFAIPMSEAKQVITSVQKYGKIVRPFLGVRYLAITPELAKDQQLPVDYGALVVRGETPADLAVTPGSPADRAGIQENDIILEAGDQKITPDRPLVDAVAAYKIGDRLELKVLHQGVTKTVTVTLVERQQ